MRNFLLEYISQFAECYKNQPKTKIFFCHLTLVKMWGGWGEGGQHGKWSNFPVLGRCGLSAISYYLNTTTEEALTLCEGAV